MTFLQNTLDYLRDFNIITIIVRLITAVRFGGFIGLERERHGRSEKTLPAGKLRKLSGKKGRPQGSVRKAACQRGRSGQ